MIANVSDYLPTWKEFMNMKENKKLNIHEAKQKYLKLQAQHNYLMEAQVAAYNAVAENAVMDGHQAGPGSELNPLKSVKFASAMGRGVNVSAGYAINVELGWQDPVIAGLKGNGDPAYNVVVTNPNTVIPFSSNQQVDCFGTGSSTRVLNFETISAVGTPLGTPGVNTLPANQAITGVSATTSVTLVSGSGVTLTYSNAGGGTFTGTTLTGGYTADAGSLTSINVQSFGTHQNRGFAVGDTIRINPASQMGPGVSGTGTATLTAADLVGDTISIARFNKVLQDGLPQDQKILNAAGLAEAGDQGNENTTIGFSISASLS